MNHRSKINVLLFVGYAACVYGAFIAFNKIPSLVYSNAPIASILVLGSLGLGIAAQLIFDWSGTQTFRYVFKRGALSILGLSILLVFVEYETILCVVIGGPVTIVLLIVGIAVTRAIIRKFDGQSHFCMPLLLIPLALPFMDIGAAIQTGTYAVTTQIEMQGSPDEIHALTQNVGTIDNAERPWTFTHSVLRAPRPLRASVKNGVRYAIWEKGVEFEEILINDANPNSLAWTFHFPDPTFLRPLDMRVSPLGPEVFLDSGQYSFAPIATDKTLVTLTTTYRLKTPMNGYLSLWGKLLLNDFHMAVLHVIANRAEENA